MFHNGFETPTSIINSPVCTLSIALLIFHLADGITYLETKSANESLPEWSNFIIALYKKIINDEFKSGKVSFVPELTKVQLFKLKKVLSENECIFINEITGTDCNIII